VAKRQKAEPRLVSLDGLSDWQRQVYLEPLELGRQVASRFLPAEQRELEISYVDSPPFNASAGRRNEQYRIRVHVSVAAILHFVFNHLFRHAALLPKLGSFAEGDTYAVFDHGIPTALPTDVSAEQAVVQLLAMSRPSDDQRTQMAAIATRIALSFCVLHEVAHVLCGHARYAALHFRGSEVTEFLGSKRPVIEHHLRRAWEYEADKTAAAALMQWLATDANLRAHLAELMGDSVERDLLWLAGFSLRVLFRLLAQVQTATSNTPVHAPAELRSEIVQNAIHFVYSGVRRKTRERLLAQSHDDADLLWEEIVPGNSHLTPVLIPQLDELEDLLASKRPGYVNLAYLSASLQQRPR